MFLSAVAVVFILSIFGGQVINGCQHEECEAHEKEQWSYGGSSNGPSSWGGQCNSGASQSPIDIITSNVVKKKSILRVKNHHVPIQSAKIVNNGHTVQLTPIDDGVQRSMTVDKTSGEFKFIQLHFHWGSSKGCGSEHLINGQATELELHMVHQNSDGKIAVFGCLYREYGHNNTELDPTIESLKLIKHKGQETDLQKPLNLSNLVPKHSHHPRDLHFYRYEGSLTTPPCSENVTWTVSKDYRTISSRQMEEFRRLRSTSEGAEECSLTDNYRPVQDLNGRSVHCYHR